MRRSWIDFPRDEAAWTNAGRFLCASRFWQICITLARRLETANFRRRDRVGKGLGSRQFLLPLAVVLAVLCMLGSTAICSTVFFAGAGTGFFAPSIPLKVDGGQPTILVAEDLSRMARRKRTIARLPQALAPGRKSLRYLRSGLAMIRIGVGQSGGLSRESSLAEEGSISTARRFFELKTPTLISRLESCDQEIATTPAILRKWLILSCDSHNTFKICESFESKILHKGADVAYICFLRIEQ